jgi:hypothetical protein
VNASARHPVVIVLLSALSFFALDNLIFRSGLLMRAVPPITASAQLFSVVHAEERRRSSGRFDVLITGNSRMEFGFSQALFSEMYPSSRLNLVKATLPGSDPKWWYYILKELDPSQDRYAAIVLQVDAFRARPAIRDAENSYDAAQTLAPIIHISECPGFASTFTDDAVRERVWKKLIFNSWGSGLEWFLPAWRVVERLAGERVKERVAIGSPLTVEDLRFSSQTGRVMSYPAHFDAFNRTEADLQFIRPSEQEARQFTAREAKFEEKWLRRIADSYRNSATKLVILQPPRWPMPLPAMMPIDSAPDLRVSLDDLPNVVFIGERNFSALENPRDFLDLLHLNVTGEATFTEELGKQLLVLIPASNGSP